VIRHEPCSGAPPIRIGLTYDLRSEYLAAGYGELETAEFDRDSTIEAIEGALRSLGHETDRIGNARRLVERLARGDRWDLVFNIAEGLHGIGRESTVPCLLDLYEIPYTFSDPMVLAVSLHKGMTKRVVRDAGVPTPDFAVVERPEDARAVRLRLPLFVKPVAEGTGKGITPASVIRAREDLAPACERLLREFRQPVLVERFLAGREFTVAIGGTGPASRVLGTMEVILRKEAEPDVYSYVNKERCEELVDYPLTLDRNDPQVRETEAVALAAWKALGCRDAGRVDVRCDRRGRAGKPQFIEVNPLAGIHPEHSDLPMICTRQGMAYLDLIRLILDSARERMKP
jgi:D-alanine-D-alanine ligase